MMKRCCLILIPLLLLCFLFGCGEASPEYEQPVLFFYPENVQEDGSVTNVISPETREGEEFDGDLHRLLADYLEGPTDPALYSPFPADAQLLEVSQFNGKITLRFSQSFAELSSLDRTIACACISMTCLEFTEADAVEIFAQNALFDGEESILLTRDNLLTKDNTPITEP